MNRFDAKQWIGCSAIALVAGTLIGCQSGFDDTDIRYIELPAIRAMQSSQGEPPQLVDVRVSSAFRSGHIPGALNLTAADILEDRTAGGRLNPKKPVIVYGQNAGSALARSMSKRLLAEGYDSVLLYEDGYDHWVSRGLDTQAAP